MESICVTLGTAKKLKAAGFPQDQTAFGYNDIGLLGHWFFEKTEREPNYAAPTAQEIADQLPAYEPSDDGFSLVIEPAIKGGWYAGYFDGMGSELHFSEGPTIAEATANLWLKLHEED